MITNSKLVVVEVSSPFTR